MCKKQLITIFLFLFFISYAQTEFITLWKPNANGTIDNSISFGGTGTSYTISWEEVGFPQHSGIMNSVTSNSNSPITISFGTPSNTNPVQATYKLKVSNGSGLFYGFRANTGIVSPSGNQELIEVSQWGSIIWLQQFDRGFASCTKLDVTAADTPNLTQISSISEMFLNCPSLVGNSSFSNWNTSTITNMRGMFNSATLFNQNIGSWNTAKVTDFSGMFSNASNFNQNISAWNTISGTDFSSMFSDAAAFNQPLNSWNTKNATTFRYTFYNAAAFNQPLNNWNTGKVTDFEHMFEKAVSFNQPIGNWDVSKVSYYAGFNMFDGASNFNQDISTWNIRLQNFSWNSIYFGFKNAGLSCTNYSNFLVALINNPTWTNSTITSGTIDATGLVYSTPQAIMARAQLINKGFNIIGDSYNSGCFLSTAEVSAKPKMPAYPNPTTGVITVESAENENAYLYDLSGKIIKNITLNKGKNKIDLTGFPSGNYLLKGNNIFTKIIKK
ncbi:BspA family leucine-rich repeat surface protein [Chryseobacterium culicis]|uniref:BspA family leucine-rich repeat surface protein n=1 Tax=Chryseobacterium culicis TaxID=680127 RepID=UPI00289E33D8|nr:BspA family leucine-rich repeat surface protein [Chryseobacterium culicis]